MRGKRVIAVSMALCSMVLSLPANVEAKKINSVSAVKKLAKAKVKGASVTEVDTDYEKGTLVYDVELHKGRYEYNLEYRASDGKLMKYEWELSYTGSSSSKKVSKAKIKTKAKNKVKNAKITRIKYDADLYKPEYDVTMQKGNKKYELTYNARNAKLVEYAWKITGDSSDKKYIGLKKAKAIASNKVPGGQFIKAEFDEDDGVAVYEIEIIKDGMEYEMKINARTGKILEYEVDEAD